MKNNFLLGMLLMAANIPQVASAQSSPAAPSGTTPIAPAPAPFSVEDTDIGTLLDDPAAKAILDKHLPGFTDNPQIEMARTMTLKAIQQFVPDKITDQALVDIRAEFAKAAKG
ncbi:hypothetical protein IP81_07365 [Novosphingobium sp. AAP83]|uniref:hypothetical protein n=1 Tax=Novosphingobium sp. AAP83 TaxID=1523425 RepID=UPI0006B9F132|nr:hypothetical protein [Novosphingobium sp. AAP83]KPF91879.1 hypothetical protein IP81_07365 [Novosphingobium sp. AAP83]